MGLLSPKGNQKNSADLKSFIQKGKGQIPENVHGMRSAVDWHCWLLLNVPNKDLAKLPAQQTPEERKGAVEVAGHLGYLTAETFNDLSKEIQLQALCIYCQNELHKLFPQRFT
ncbi:hypothetical protein O181_017158 [Austropuccinia psidii MF-1]|uniref:Uncharacterized protein n=1 Tax=Austropuccinia psidii MF-1 TaxID=1389203 RepID=A0A9Q3GRJ4_9BASI|nr:hypothetical protein [Austropuccinia psidii MF-1]